VGKTTHMQGYRSLVNESGLRSLGEIRMGSNPIPCINHFNCYSSVVEYLPSKQVARVRFTLTVLSRFSSVVERLSCKQEVECAIHSCGNIWFFHNLLELMKKTTTSQ